MDKDLFFFTKAVTYEDGSLAMDNLLEKNNDLDGVFCTADILALGALQFLLRNDINAPDEVKVVGFDDITSCARSIPPLSTIHQSVELISELAVQNLISMINGNPIEKPYIKLPPEAQRSF